MLIYATSNRRHLIRESFRDKEERDEELHTNDTVQEKLSLVARFGVTIYFGKPAKKEFQEIVRQLAKRNGIEMDEEQLLLEANRWGVEPRRHVRADSPAVYRLSAGDGNAALMI